MSLLPLDLELPQAQLISNICYWCSVVLWLLMWFLLLRTWPVLFPLCSQILQIKVNRLEHLIQLKDLRIEDLTKHLERHKTRAQLSWAPHWACSQPSPQPPSIWACSKPFFFVRTNQGSPPAQTKPCPSQSLEALSKHQSLNKKDTFYFVTVILSDLMFRYDSTSSLWLLCKLCVCARWSLNEVLLCG